MDSRVLDNLKEPKHAGLLLLGALFYICAALYLYKKSQEKGNERYKTYLKYHLYAIVVFFAAGAVSLYDIRYGAALTVFIIIVELFLFYHISEEKYIPQEAEQRYLPDYYANVIEGDYSGLMGDYNVQTPN